MTPRKKDEEVEETEPKVVPIGRFAGEEGYRKLKELAEQSQSIPEKGGQPDPAAKEEEEE
jgi:hypothetical protein